MAVIKRKKLASLKPAKPSVTKTEMDNAQLELYRVKQQKKLLETREKELIGRLTPYMESVIKPDSKGHYLYSTMDENGNKIHLQRQARKKIVLNQERAIKFLEAFGYPQAIVNKNVVASDVTQDQIIEVLEKHAPHLLDNVSEADESALEQLVMDGTIGMEEFERLCDINITYAMTYIDDKKLQESDKNGVEGERKSI